jgi:hypothetical protein
MRILIVLLLGGCEVVYPCTSSKQCVNLGVQGVCLPAGAGQSYCAFPDGKCPGTGLHWDTSAPTEIEGFCVAPVPDGGLP